MGEPAAAPQPIARPSVADADAILGRPFTVLDDGFVRVVDYMGDDSAIVQAARVSYGKGTKQVHEDRGLIRYLMRHAHTTPFEMCEIKLHVRVPMDCWRQWIRHRTANVNEYSTRYSVAIDAAQRTAPDAWRAQSAANRQGSARLARRPRSAHAVGRGGGAAATRARGVRGAPRGRRRARAGAQGPAALDLHRGLLEDRPAQPAALPRAADGRARAAGDPRVRRRRSASEIVARWVPVTWEAFLDYRRHALTLSSLEVALVSALAAGDAGRALSIAADHGIVNRTADGRLASNVERAEIDAKLRALGWTPPWEAAP